MYIYFVLFLAHLAKGELLLSLRVCRPFVHKLLLAELRRSRNRLLVWWRAGGVNFSFRTLS